MSLGITMNAKPKVVSPARLGLVSLMRNVAVLPILAIVCQSMSAQELAPVVDAADTNAWVNSPSNGGGAGDASTGSMMQPTAIGYSAQGILGQGNLGQGSVAQGCTGGACGTGSLPTGVGIGPNGNYGFPLWAGACNEPGCAGGCGGNCAGGNCAGGNCGPVGYGPVGGGNVYSPMMGYGASGMGACGGGSCGAGPRGFGSIMGLGGGGLMGGSGMLGRGQAGCACGGRGACGACRKRKFRVDVWGEFIYMRPRNAEVAYAVPVDGPVVPTLGNGIQIGPTGVVEMDHRPGFRVGANIYGPKCNGLMWQWTHFESSSDDFTQSAAPDVVRSLVTHPLGNDAASDGLNANANLDIDYDLIDVAFRLPWKKNRCWCAEMIWGVRYGQLSQGFISDLDLNGTTTVETDIDFNGIGPRIGMLAQRRIGCRGFYAYTQGDASFLVGSFDADYQQRDSFAGVVVENSWESGRVVSQLDYELGIGMMSKKGRFRLRAGYIVSAWFNAVRTNEFINSVQVNDQDHLGDGLTFDGFVVRTEFRF
jgi:hypothetical protein